MIKYVSYVLFLFSCVFVQGHALETALKPHWDSENTPLRKFRLATDPYLFEGEDAPSREGLDRLRISGSGQFNELQLHHILQKAPTLNMMIVDMRREMHGFADGNSVSWKVYNAVMPNDRFLYHFDAPIEEIQFAEKSLLISLKGRETSFDCEPEPVSLFVNRVETEQELVKKYNLGYKKFFVLDNNPPTNAQIDEIVEFIQTLPEDVWVHVHCYGGMGRTTSFMIIYDMMQNAHLASADDIIKRHYWIGGQNIFNIHEGYNDPGHAYYWKYLTSIERREKLRQFHQYCLEHPSFDIKWSEWRDSQTQ